LTSNPMSAIMRKAVGLGSNGFSKHNRLTGVVMSNYIVVNGIRIARDFEPETFGRLTTIGPRFRLSNSKGVSHSYQVCVCTCGVVGVYSCGSMCKGGTSSCGCYRRELIKDRFATHRESDRTIEFAAWSAMRQRCLSPTCQQYHNYGGRGIKICDRWLEPDGRGYMNFLEDMGRRPSNKYSLDRIDVNGDYCPENCRWATLKEQNRNKRNTVFITAFGETKTLIEFAEQYNIPYRLVFYRIQKGWDTEKAITTPSRASRDKKNT